MPKALSVGVIGDFNPASETHKATNLSFTHSASSLKAEVNLEWVPTPSLEEHTEDRLERFDALLCAPGSPYKSMKGALNGIRFARENNRPFLGTCGGFQHAVIEYARNVMGILDAEHAEEHPEAPNPYITLLACSLVGRVEEVKLVHGSHAFTVYGRPSTTERFYCSYGLNPLRRKELEEAGLQFPGFDVNGEARILELPKARFFLATLFVPQTSSTPSRPHSMITSLLQTAQTQ
jgi:CTP synthase (UTP-ammonia lyase)